MDAEVASSIRWGNLDEEKQTFGGIYGNSFTSVLLDQDEMKRSICQEVDTSLICLTASRA